MLWLGSPQHQELYYRAAALGRLGTTGKVSFISYKRNQFVSLGKKKNQNYFKIKNMKTQKLSLKYICYLNERNASMFVVPLYKL